MRANPATGVRARVAKCWLYDPDMHDRRRTRQNGRTALVLAIKSQCWSIMDALFAKGANANAKDEVQAQHILIGIRCVRR